MVQSLSLLTNRNLPYASDLVGTWPRGVAADDLAHGRLVSLPIDLGGILWPVGVSTRKNSVLSPTAEALLSALRAVGSGPAPRDHAWTACQSALISIEGTAGAPHTACMTQPKVDGMHAAGSGLRIPARDGRHAPGTGGARQGGGDRSHVPCAGHVSTGRGQAGQCPGSRERPDRCRHPRDEATRRRVGRRGDAARRSVADPRAGAAGTARG